MELSVISFLEVYKKTGLLALLTALEACSTISDCDYRAHENSWVDAKNPPVEIINDHNRNNYWFTNEQGDFLACSELLKRGVCGNLYEIYRKQGNGAFLHDHLLCME